MHKCLDRHINELDTIFILVSQRCAEAVSTTALNLPRQPTLPLIARVMIPSMHDNLRL
jgi:hypothetical protein